MADFARFLEYTFNEIKKPNISIVEYILNKDASCTEYSLVPDFAIVVEGENSYTGKDSYMIIPISYLEGKYYFVSFANDNEKKYLDSNELQFNKELSNTNGISIMVKKSYNQSNPWEELYSYNDYEFKYVTQDATYSLRKLSSPKHIHSRDNMNHYLKGVCNISMLKKGVFQILLDHDKIKEKFRFEKFKNELQRILDLNIRMEKSEGIVYELIRKNNSKLKMKKVPSHISSRMSSGFDGSFAKNCNMDYLTKLIDDIFPYPVINNSGIEGGFDINIRLDEYNPFLVPYDLNKIGLDLKKTKKNHYIWFLKTFNNTYHSVRRKKVA